MRVPLAACDALSAGPLGVSRLIVHPGTLRFGLLRLRLGVFAFDFVDVVGYLEERESEV